MCFVDVTIYDYLYDDMSNIVIYKVYMKNKYQQIKSENQYRAAARINLYSLVIYSNI